ncbi:MAG: hypothetical protein MUF21_06610 [Gemmatimonadaceae bacterium]|nr:hypothetical protein [Gemmatimonadaceae bacterium]
MESLFLPLLVQVAVAPVRAETLLVKPVAMPAAWYDVATGFFAIAGTLLLLVIGVLLLGLARAIQGAGQTVGRKLETLSGELVPLARRLHDVAGDLQEVTQQVKGDIARLGGTAGAVDETVRDVLAVTERRVARLAARRCARWSRGGRTRCPTTRPRRRHRCATASMRARVDSDVPRAHRCRRARWSTITTTTGTRRRSRAAARRGRVGAPSPMPPPTRAMAPGHTRPMR